MFRLISILFSTLFLFAIIGGGGDPGGVLSLRPRLPDYRQLAHYSRRSPPASMPATGGWSPNMRPRSASSCPSSAIPKLVIDAFLAAEDRNFYHPSRHRSDRHPARRGQGPAHRCMAGPPPGRRLDHHPAGGEQFPARPTTSDSAQDPRGDPGDPHRARLPKDKILELYLNEIYLGQGSYGVAAAALNYFDKSLDELDVSRSGLPGGLPKAPANYDPQRNPAGRQGPPQLGDRPDGGGQATSPPARRPTAKAEPLVDACARRGEPGRGRRLFRRGSAPRAVAAEYGEEALYEGGLQRCASTIDPRAAGDRRRGACATGWSPMTAAMAGAAPVSHIDASAGWKAAADAQVARSPAWHRDWQLAVVLQARPTGQATIGLGRRHQGRIPMTSYKWAARAENQSWAPAPRRPAEVVQPGDVVLVEPVAKARTARSATARDFRAAPDSRSQGRDRGDGPAYRPRAGACQGGFSYAASANSTAPRRRCASPVRPSSRSSMSRRWTMATRLVQQGAGRAVRDGSGARASRSGGRRISSANSWAPPRCGVGIEKSRNVMTVRLAARWAWTRWRPMPTASASMTSCRRMLANVAGRR